jgi:sterol desaturase/sphingolipid hydroxylase (fatty acid hydroxylase superfamily)
METLNQLLAINPNYILIGLMVLFYSLELFLPVEFKFQQKPKHQFHNMILGLIFVVVSFFWATVAVFTIDWLNSNKVGLFFLISLPAWLQLILSVMLFDFVTYWFHRMAHNLPLIWRLHRVHHSDTKMDASSNLRSHPIEFIFWFGPSNVIAAAIFGLSSWSLAVYFLIITPLFFLEHSNLKFPLWLDKTVGLIFTTPNMHKLHHEQDQYYTDSNYADIFILWDRVFGTFKYKQPSQITFGLKEFDEDKKQTFWYLLKSPFINMNRVSTDQLGNEKRTTNT